MDLLGHQTWRRQNFREGGACGADLDGQMAHPVRLCSSVIAYPKAGQTQLSRDPVPHPCHAFLRQPLPRSICGRDDVQGGPDNAGAGRLLPGPFLVNKFYWNPATLI